MNPQVNMALRAALQAGRVIVRAFDRLDRLTIEEKGRNDLVSEIDRAAEAEIAEVLHKAYPHHGIMGEESGALVEDQGDGVWVIDPLDGTNNYLSGIPHFAVSIGFRYGGWLEHAVVLDPLRNEEFTASRGQGARMNGRRLRVNSTTHLHRSVVGSGIPARSLPDHLVAHSSIQHEIVATVRSLRTMGSAALDLAWVAAGRYDAFWEFALQPWDLAAGGLLVTEAGGLVTDITGEDHWYDSGFVLAATPKVHRAMREVIDRHMTPELFAAARNQNG